MTSGERRYRLIQEYVATSCGDLRYWRSEPEQGEAIVLVHGYGARLEHWRRVLRPLARNHTVYAVDMPGFGLSCKPRRRYNREWLAQQIHEFQQLAVRRPAIFVGHSMGGMVVAQLAKDYAAGVRGLVLVDSGGMRDPDRAFSASAQVLFGALRIPLVGEAMALFMANRDAVRQGLLQSYYDKSHVDEALVDLFAEPLLLPGGTQSYLAATREFENYQLDIVPGEVTVPVLIIWGEQDASLSPRMAAEFQRRMFPQAERVIIPDCGHNPFDECPEPFLAALLPWLERAIAPR
jgi:pimeloyl-ACP methyl ester carboxylesterase